MLLSAALTACDGGGTPPQAGGGADTPRRSRPLAVCTTPMVGDLVRLIAGDNVEVVTLMSAGTDPHLWTPTRTEVVSILEADAVFMNGLMLEGRAGDAFARVEQAGRPVVRVAESVGRNKLTFDPTNSSVLDPHVWMDPVLWASTAPAVVDGLSKIAPNSRGSFEGNAQRFAASATELDAQIRTAVLSVPNANRVLVTAHDAFGYFGRRYGLTVHGLQGLSTESEPSLAQVERIVGIVCEARLPSVFAETTVNDRTVRAVIEGCAARGHEVRLGEPLFSDSLGRPTLPEGTWAGMLRHNARAIVEGLGGRW